MRTLTGRHSSSQFPKWTQLQPGYILQEGGQMGGVRQVGGRGHASLTHWLRNSEKMRLGEVPGSVLMPPMLDE